MKLYLLVLVLLLACLSTVYSQNATAVTVTVNGFTFVPASVSVARGQCVLWTGLGATHNVAQSASNNATTRLTTGFYSGAPGTVPQFRYCFNTTGTYYYICEPHAAMGMRGTVIVTGTGPTPIPTPRPKTTPRPQTTTQPIPGTTTTPTQSASSLFTIAGLLLIFVLVI